MEESRWLARVLDATRRAKAAAEGDPRRAGLADGLDELSRELETRLAESLNESETDSPQQSDEHGQ